MNRVKQISFFEFEWILSYARKEHEHKNEPIPLMGEENKDKIRSCLATPFQTFDGKYLYRGFLEKAAILFYLIAKGHALQNGNKRMAILCLSYFYHKNDHPLILTDDQLYEVAKRTAESTIQAEAVKFIRTILLMQNKFAVKHYRP